MSHPVSEDNSSTIYIGLKSEENMIKDEIWKYLSMHEEVKFPHWQRKCLHLAKENSCSWKMKMATYANTGLVTNMLAQQKCMQARRP